jgi:hypothetical protein
MTVAKALEGANLMWQRVFEFTLTQASTPAARGAFLRDLKLWLATQKGNPKLQYVTWSNLTTQQVTVPEVSQGGATLYAVYNFKQATATAAYFKYNDSATLAGGANGANMVGLQALLVAKHEALQIYPNGLALVTGLVVASETTAAGGANSASGDGPNGFAILG